MCVIAFAAKGVDIPSDEKLKEMWDHNSDGAGYAYVGRNGKVVFKKGFLKFDDLLKDLTPKREKLKNTNFAIHFRIGTSGKNDGHTCHPFPISTDFGQLRKLEGKEDAVLFHNGIIGTGKLINELSSDTQDFVAAMAPLIAKYNKSKARDAYLAEITKGNKFLILYKNSKVKMFGSWEKDGDLLVSNTLYQSYYSVKTYTHGSSTVPATITERLGDSTYYWDDDYDYRTYHQNDTLEPPKQTIPAWAKPLTESQAVHVRRLWDELIRSGYVSLDKDEISMLKRTADDYDADYLYRDNYVFGYGDSYGCAWLEFTPEEQDLPDLTAVRNGKGTILDKPENTVSKKELDDVLAGLA